MVKKIKTKYLVTGGAGFIGSHLADKLIERGNKVSIIDNLSFGKKKNLNPKAQFYKLDINSQKVSQIFKKERPEIVFHLAAQISVRKSLEDPVFDAKTNILGSLNVLENCRIFGVKKIIFSSSGGTVYGETKTLPTKENYPAQPLCSYGVAKLAVEKYLDYYFRVFKLPFISLRLANVFGPRQNSKGEAGVVAIFFDNILSGKEPIINGSGLQTRDFIFVEDVVDAHILSAKKEKTGIFNIGTGRETDINLIFKKINKITGLKIRKKNGPEKKGEQIRSCLDWSLAKKELAWQPKYSLEKGLEKTCEWFRIKE